MIVTIETSQYNRVAMCTDLHYGKKGNSSQHNQDCTDYIDWFCNQVKADSEIDCILFLGDWHENRAALNIATMKYSFKAAQKLNDLGLPVYFIVGNHDLYHRHTRETHSLLHFDELENFTIVDTPIVVSGMGDKGSLVSPFLFHDEYPDMKQYLNCSNWFGHFEFKGFIVTGHSVRMPTGPEMADYQGPDMIFSGHFHKRQVSGNVCYIGSCFPYDFSDAGDSERGMAVYDFRSKETQFINWPDCPQYVKCTWTELANGLKLPKQARVKCVADIHVDFDEGIATRQLKMDEFELREFTLEESSALNDVISNDDSVVDVTDEDMASVDDLVVTMLSEIKADQIDNDLLVVVYNKLMKED